MIHVYLQLRAYITLLKIYKLDEMALSVGGKENVEIVVEMLQCNRTSAVQYYQIIQILSSKIDFMDHRTYFQGDCKMFYKTTIASVAPVITSFVSP